MNKIRFFILFSCLIFNACVPASGVCDPVALHQHIFTVDYYNFNGEFQPIYIDHYADKVTNWTYTTRDFLQSTIIDPDIPISAKLQASDYMSPVTLPQDTRAITNQPFYQDSSSSGLVQSNKILKQYPDKPTYSESIKSRSPVPRVPGGER